MVVHSIVTTGSTACVPSVNLMGTAHSMMCQYLQSIYVIKRIRQNILKVSMIQSHAEGVLSVVIDIIPGYV